MKRRRMQPDDRRKIIVLAAVAVARRDGLASVTFEAVAAACSIETTERTIRHYFATYRALWLATAKQDRPALWQQAVDLGIATE